MLWLFVLVLNNNFSFIVCDLYCIVCCVDMLVVCIVCMICIYMDVFFRDINFDWVINYRIDLDVCKICMLVGIGVKWWNMN